MTLWTKNDAANPADTVVSGTITLTKIVTVTDTTGLLPTDLVSGTGIATGTTIASVDSATQFTLSQPATNGVGVSITAVHKNPNKPKFLKVAEQANTFGVDPLEAGSTKVTHSGWVKVTTGSGGRAGRKQYETIIAMGSLTGAASDDSAFPNPIITISGQPAAQTIRVASGVTGGSPLTLSATVSSTGGVATSYQWQVSANGTTGWTNLVNGATISGALTNTLTVSAEVIGTHYYRLQVTSTTLLGAPLVVDSNNAQFIGAQQCASTTWATGFVTVTSAAHRLVTGDTPTLAGFTPSAYNGVAPAITVVDANTFTYPLVTDPGVVTVLGTVTQAISSTNLSLTWATGTATVTTTAAHRFVTGDSVVIAGVTPAGYNGTYTITVTGASTFTYALVADPTGAATVMGTSASSIVDSPSITAWTTNRVTTTVTGHGYTVGAKVLNFGGFTPSGYNVTTVGATVVNANSITYPVVGSLAVVSVEGYVYA